MPQSRLALPNPDDITRIVLPNGLIILVRENHSSPVAVLEGCLPAGSIYDTKQTAGLAAYVASMLTRGSENYGFDAFNETIENVGASLGVSAGAHCIDFGITCLTEDFDTLLSVLADALRRPVFPVEHIERLRRQKLVGLQERDQDTQQVASLRFYEAIYGEHPYGLPTGGYPQSVTAITRADIQGFYERHFTPRGAVVVVTGDVDVAHVVERVQHHFADWQGTEPEAPPLPPSPPGDRSIRVPMPGKVQSDIVIGRRAVKRADADYYAVRVANTILGRFGMMGRLGERVREEQGLAYYAYSSQDADMLAGVWVASAGVNPAHVEQATESILDEFACLRDEQVSAEEMSDSQAYMTGVLPLTLETNEGVASTLLSMEWYGLGLDYLLRYRDLIYGVTAADVQRVARHYLGADGCVIAVAGLE